MRSWKLNNTNGCVRKTERKPRIILLDYTKGKSFFFSLPRPIIKIYMDNDEIKWMHGRRNFRLVEASCLEHTKLRDLRTEGTLAAQRVQ